MGGSVTASRYSDTALELLKERIREIREIREIMKPHVPREVVDALTAYLDTMASLYTATADAVASYAPLDLVEALHADAGTSRVITMFVDGAPVSVMIDGQGRRLDEDELSHYWDAIQNGVFEGRRKFLELRGAV